MKKCVFVKSDGEACQANTIKESEFCFSHDPNMIEEKIAAVSKGGSSPRRNYSPLVEIKIEHVKDVVNLLSTTISEVRAGSVELRVANCIGYLSGHLIKALGLADLEERIVRLEKHLEVNAT